ncbi:hypothetical protein KM043_012773 [Ampulex compressa]|nr:hypothetical protein KM043_012773 [Ampulex compressa]
MNFVRTASDLRGQKKGAEEEGGGGTGPEGGRQVIGARGGGNGGGPRRRERRLTTRNDTRNILPRDEITGWGTNLGDSWEKSELSKERDTGQATRCDSSSVFAQAEGKVSRSQSARTEAAPRCKTAD